jgi:DNA-binding NarL/FixJ family response regulator
MGGKMTINRARDYAPLTRLQPGSDGQRPIRLLIADDHALLRQALRLLLQSREDLEVVNGRDAVDAAERLRPDVVLMDMAMPGLNGIDATRQLVKRVPGTRVLILTAYIEDERLVEALRAGASGYMLKSSDLDEPAIAIHSVHRGNTYLCSAVSREIDLNDLLLRVRQPGSRIGYDLLTNREREVLQLLAEGHSNQEVADELVISVKTVEAHRANIMEKLHAKNRTDLIRYALKRALVTLESPELDAALRGRVAV